MSARLAAAARLVPLAHWLAAQGLAGADLEAKGDLLIVRLPPAGRARLLREKDLRGQVVSQGKGLGFSRVALDLPLE